MVGHARGIVVRALAATASRMCSSRGRSGPESVMVANGTTDHGADQRVYDQSHIDAKDTKNDIMSVANPLNWGGGVGTLHGQLLQRGALQRRRSFQCDQSSGCALACFAAPHEAHAGSRGRCNALRPVCLVGIQLSL
ncbi:hypothetical protein D3C85_846260 [compost metagenome]